MATQVKKYCKNCRHVTSHSDSIQSEICLKCGYDDTLEEQIMKNKSSSFQEEVDDIDDEYFSDIIEH